MKNFNLNIKGCFLAILLLANHVFAQDYIVPSNGAVTASLSDKGVNRVAIENDRIAQVIGNEDEYIIESDVSLGQIFLTPALKSMQEINLRLVTEREKIIDIKFTIKKIEPQTINFKYKNDVSIHTTNPNSAPGMSPVTHLNDEVNVAQQVIENIKLVHNNKLQAVKVPELSCLKQNAKLKDLKLVEASKFSLNKQIIIKAMVSNSKNETMQLKEIDFSNCMSLVNAVVLSADQLAPKMHATVYLVGIDGK